MQTFLYQKTPKSATIISTFYLLGKLAFSTNDRSKDSSPTIKEKNIKLYTSGFVQNLCHDSLRDLGFVFAGSQFRLLPSLLDRVTVPRRIWTPYHVAMSHFPFLDKYIESLEQGRKIQKIEIMTRMLQMQNDGALRNKQISPSIQSQLFK